MRVVGWLAGLGVIAAAAIFYTPTSVSSLETWLSVGIIAAVWSMVLWNSTIVDRAATPRDGDSRGLFAILLSVALVSMGVVFVVAVHAQAAGKGARLVIFLAGCLTRL